VAIVSGALAGCGRSDVPRLTSVHGQATHAGKPLPDLTVYFEPEKGRPCTGITHADGEYELSYDRQHQGAPAGKYRVWVAYVPQSPEQEIRLQTGQEKLPDPYPAVLEKYGDRKTTPMEVEVGKSDSTLNLAFD
jgi:hypothetical protein